MPPFELEKTLQASNHISLIFSTIFVSRFWRQFTSNSFPPIFNHHNDIWIHTASFCWTHKWCKYNTYIEESFTWMHFLHNIRLNLLSVSIITFHKDLFNKRKCVHTYLSTNALNVDDTVSIPMKQLADCSVQINIVF